MTSVPPIRIRRLNQIDYSTDGKYVLYWMISARRSTWNFGLQHAVDLAEKLQRPLLVLEALRVGYQWASDRLHRFVLQGMADNRRALAATPARYLAYVEPEGGAGSGLLESLAKHACCVVTDEFPCFFLPHMVERVSERLNVSLEAVDSNGLLPLAATEGEFTTAYSFRRFLQRSLPPFLLEMPRSDPFVSVNLPPFRRLPEGITRRWPDASNALLTADSSALGQLPIDHSVTGAVMDGGAEAAEDALQTFLDQRLHRYHTDRNQPEGDAASGLSPWLHFGHISAHEVFTRLAEQECWSPDSLSEKASGARQGWWGMNEPAEAFLDELITWRELGYVFCYHQSDYDQFESLPEWAQRTLADHASDERPYVYSLEDFESAGTHGRLWNAAQTQLVSEGRMHNYLRMLWGKKILHWSESPQEALRIMVELNNRYAVDGRNPNSYSGIFWVLGRFDRAWGPERPIFGKVRYMTSENTARKLKVDGYVRKYSPAG